jgi:hypothetical protein
MSPAYLVFLKDIWIRSSVADLECLSRIPDPNFSIPDPGSKRFRIQGKKDPGSGCASKNLSIFNPAVSKLSKMIWHVNPGSGFFFPSRIRIRDTGVEKTPDSRIPDPDPQH